MVKTEFYPLEIGYKSTEEGVYLQLYGRTKDGWQLCVQQAGFEPYLYVLSEKASPEDVANKITAMEIMKNDAPVRITRTEIVEKKYLGKKLRCVKAYTKYPGDLSAIRNAIYKTIDAARVFESDLGLVRKALLDKAITPMVLTEAEVEQNSTELIENPKIMAFDIETHKPAGRPANPEENPVLMISLTSDTLSKTIVSKKFDTSDERIEFVETEFELLKRFEEIISEQKPDILVGYYSDSFDLPYLLRRAEKNHLRLDIGLDYSVPDIERGSETVTSIAGIVHIDLSKFIRKTIAATLQTQNYGLNSVAKEILSKTREELKTEELAAVYDNSPQELGKFCDYNLVGSDLIFQLTTNLMPNMIELVKLTGVPLHELTRMGFSQLAENYLINRLWELNELIPPSPQRAEMMKRRLESYQGAFVYQPKPGMYSNIAVFDFRSLYPTIITSHNISPDTLNCECCQGRTNVPGEKHWFCKNKKGILSAVVDELISRRLRIKEMIKAGESSPVLKAREYALKTIANSIYGYLGFYLARWYCRECVQSISSYGRYYITSLIEKANSEGYEVLYSDTDSVFLALNTKPIDSALNFMGLFNMGLPEQMELEYHGFYPRGIFVSTKQGEYGAKKRYALLTRENSLIIKGFETVRRNTSPIARRTQQKLLEITLKENNPQKALDYVKTIIAKIRERKIPIEEMIIFTQLQKRVEEYESIGPHVAIAKKLQEKGIQIGPGSMIGYVICGIGELVRDRAKLPEECSSDDYDVDYYINNQIIPSVERILEVIGYSKEDLLSDKDQKKLNRFFK